MRRLGILTLVAVFCWALPAGAKMMSVGKDNVNVRSGPSLKAEILFEAPLGYPIHVKEQKGKWVRFQDWEGYSGWIYRPLVSNVHTVVVSVPTANVRSGPGLKNRVLMKVNKGDIFKVLAKRGNWVKLGYYYSGDTVGWIRHDLIWGD